MNDSVLRTFLTSLNTGAIGQPPRHGGAVGHRTQLPQVGHVVLPRDATHAVLAGHSLVGALGDCVTEGGLTGLVVLVGPRILNFAS